ncbi:MAG TPA: endolytic transglycosylase MltG, partial [Oscillospiraceae bacterium]|nr:endolytic transglycosylase MltG [Oscillospiraceae bacterium]
KGSNTNRVFGGILLAVTIVCISLLLSFVIIFAGMDLLGAGKSDKLIDIEIPQNATTADIAEILKEKDVIRIPFLFRTISYLQSADGKYQYGAFTLKPSMSYEEIIDNLQEINVIREYVSVPIPEGYTLKQISITLEQYQVCKAEDFIRYANAAKFDYFFEKQVPVDSLKFYAKEGYLFPATYDFYIDELPENVVSKFFAKFDEVITEDMYARMDELDMSLNEVMTLASIVQSEAGNIDDMKLIASVFYNRLNNSDVFPKLQSDPTTKYVNTIIKPTIAKSDYGLYEDMFTAYDTYSGAGLPPGAINNPGLDAINAVLYPEDSPYYFFCANVNTREVYYAVTLAEHEQNLRTAGLL